MYDVHPEKAEEEREMPYTYTSCAFDEEAALLQKVRLEKYGVDAVGEVDGAQ